MRYVVIGAGAVGGTVGGLLHRSGRDVVLVARGEHLARMRSRGLQLVTGHGDDVVAVPVAAGPDELTLTADDVLVLATKSQHTVDALTAWAWAPVATPAGPRPASAVLPLVCAQNGVDNEPAALRWFARVAGMCVWLPADMPEPGVVVAPCLPLTAMLHLGWYPSDPLSRNLSGDTDVLRVMAMDVEASWMAAPLPDDVMAWKRAKLLSNLGNAFDALVVADDDWQPVVERAQEEARTVFAAAGLSVVGAEQEAAVRGDRVTPTELPGYPRGGGSTYQSVARGADSVETDHLNGEVVRLGRRHGVATPVNAAVQQLAARAVRDRVAPRSIPLRDLEALVAVQEP